MKSSIFKSLLYLSGFTILIFSACGKDSNADSEETPTTPTEPDCKLIKQYTIKTLSSQYKFEYDANFNPSKISYYDHNGALYLYETIQPDNLQFNYGETDNFYLKTTFDTKFQDKLPTNFQMGWAPNAIDVAGDYTYDSKSRLLSVKGGTAENGKYDESLATTISFTYDGNDNLSKITYTYKNRVTKYFEATGFDDHVTPFHNIKNSWIYQHDFIFFSTELGNIRFLFDRLSAHNALGYVLHETDVPDYLFTETFKYTYDTKGQPLIRNVDVGVVGEITSGYVDGWEYECK